MITDAHEIFEMTKDSWIDDDLTGKEIFEFANKEAQKRGLILSTNASGHRLGAFPIHGSERGNLFEIDTVPEPYEWVLEIHLINEKLGLGSFFEDLLK